MTQPVSDGDPGSLYNLVGGLPTMQRLVDAFYRGVEDDPVLRPLYPPSLDEPRQWLALFLAQYWGGPPVYSQRRGHPRLRMRHVPFVIGQRERDAWLGTCSRRSTRLASQAGPRQMQRYFADAATFMIGDVEDRT